MAAALARGACGLPAAKALAPGACPAEGSSRSSWARQGASAGQQAAVLSSSASLGGALPFWSVKSRQWKSCSAVGIRAETVVDQDFDIVQKAQSSKSAALVLIRHGESLWNLKNLFTGCVDVPLSAMGIEEALQAGRRIAEIPVDLIFVSALIRAQMTAMIAMTQHRKKKVPVVLHNESDRAKRWSTIFSEKSKDEIIPVISAWELNERMYGELQGYNKKETADQYGADKVKEWRRSYDIPPPNGESLEMCAERAVAYFKRVVEPELKAGKNVLISAHGNSLRAIIMYLDSLTSEEVIELELATGNPMLYVYEGDKYLRRGSPIAPGVDGVYALTSALANYRQQLESTSQH